MSYFEKTTVLVWSLLIITCVPAILIAQEESSPNPMATDTETELRALRE
jgi:hypothetical protein